MRQYSEILHGESLELDLIDSPPVVYIPKNKNEWFICEWFGNVFMVTRQEYSPPYALLADGEIKLPSDGKERAVSSCTYVYPLDRISRMCIHSDPKLEAIRRA
jgi:hypothetical protein